MKHNLASIFFSLSPITHEKCLMINIYIYIYTGYLYINFKHDRFYRIESAEKRTPFAISALFQKCSLAYIWIEFSFYNPFLSALDLSRILHGFSFTEVLPLLQTNYRIATYFFFFFWIWGVSVTHDESDRSQYLN